MSKKRCPIPGCNFTYENSIVGWHRHIALPSAHPHWHPTLTDETARRSKFAAEFPAFFEGTRSTMPSSIPPRMPAPAAEEAPPSRRRLVTTARAEAQPQPVAVAMPPYLAVYIRETIREVMRETFAEWMSPTAQQARKSGNGR